ncbi:MAG TPA: GntR family transcriptional regulator [Armatimonadota bacterium]|jgi:DNA-binding LacI/PurR family transcriptional regulator
MASVNKQSLLPRYVQARRYLEELIRREGLGPGDQLPSERELSEEFRVSHMTMNRAIQEMVRDRLLTREVGRGTFVVRLDARAPHLGALGLVSLVNAGEIKADTYAGGILRGAHTAALETGWDLVLIQEALEYPAGVSARLAGRANGFLIVSSPDDAIPTLRHLRDEGTPFLSVGSSWLDEDIPAVDSDNILGSDLAVGHLASLGHTRIGLIGAPEYRSNARDRRVGFEAALNARGLPFSRRWNVPCPGEAHVSDDEREQIVAIARAPDGPTAFVAAGYLLAVITIEALGNAGLSVPNDVSVVGFDDKVSAAFLSPALTTVAQPLEEMGFRAVKRLEGIVRGEPAGGVERLPTSLVVRESAGPAPKSVARLAP